MRSRSAVLFTIASLVLVLVLVTSRAWADEDDGGDWDDWHPPAFVYAPPPVYYAPPPPVYYAPPPPVYYRPPPAYYAPPPPVRWAPGFSFGISIPIH